MTAILLWYLMMAIMVAGLAIILWSGKLVRAFLGLLIVLLGVAGLYFLSGTEFLAAAQIMVYIGGILVLMAFGLMLSDRDDHNEPINTSNGRIYNLLLCLGLGALLVMVVNRFLASTKLPSPLILAPQQQVQQLGISLMTTHLLPLELVGILLLVALVGALVIAGKNIASE
jgi:NADH:ubiquinone oxidoreductase subunit 6 (subunit J)